MDEFMTFRNRALDYIRRETALIKRDIAEHEKLSEGQKVDNGLLIKGAELVSSFGSTALYRTTTNYTKLRAGDKVKILSDEGSVNAIVDNNAIEEMQLTVECTELIPSKADIAVVEFDGGELLINLLSLITFGSPGAGYLKNLSGETIPGMRGLGGFSDLKASEIPVGFNEAQNQALRMMSARPSLAYVQGTPGSGKTHLLAVASKLYVNRGKDVAIVSLTHQAVNNALNKVTSIDQSIPVSKIGPVFKNEGLSESVTRFENFGSYIAARKTERHFMSRTGHVVGMTFQSAIANLGMKCTAFMPQMLIFDEAGQMPLTHAAVLGAFKCGSVILIGDDAQMPPIYHPELEQDPMSESVFSYVKRTFPNNGIVLDVTYRMNDEITSFVGRNFYEPHGIRLVSSKNSIGNVLGAHGCEWKFVNESSIELVSCLCPGARDDNPVEADAIVDKVSYYLSHGLPKDRIAIICPYRRQARLVRARLLEAFGSVEFLPLVDTVERLQGQDVEVILISFSVNDLQYFVAQREFLFNAQRLNVMVSRATSKVCVFASTLVAEYLEAHYGIGAP